MINNHDHEREQKGKQWPQIGTESYCWLTAASYQSDWFNKSVLIFANFFSGLFQLDTEGYAFYQTMCSNSQKISVPWEIIRIHIFRRNQNSISSILIVSLPLKLVVITGNTELDKMGHKMSCLGLFWSICVFRKSSQQEGVGPLTLFLPSAWTEVRPFSTHTLLF